MILRKILSVVLLCTTLFSTVSCGIVVVRDLSDTYPVRETEDTESMGDTVEPNDRYQVYEPDTDGRTMAENALAEIMRADYDDVDVRIYTADQGTFFSDGDVGMTARYLRERQTKVENRLGVRLAYEYMTAGEMESRAKAERASDGVGSDILMVPVYALGMFQSADLIEDLAVIKTIDVSKPYFHAESVAACTFGNKIYGAAGDAVLSPEMFTAVFMNTDLMKTLGLDAKELYSSVRKKTWTWDMMLDFFAEARIHSDVDHFLLYDKIERRLPELVFKSTGVDFLKNDDSVPTLAYESETAEVALTFLNKIFYRRDITAEEAVMQFKKGRTVYMIDTLDAMSKLRNAEEAWGILPLPTYEKGGEYRTLVDHNLPMFTVSVTSGDKECAALTIEALNATSYGYYRELYVNEQTENTLRDNDSCEMLDIIFDSVAYDMAFTLGNSVAGVADATYGLIRRYAGGEVDEDVFREKVEQMNDAVSVFIESLTKEEESVENKETEESSEGKDVPLPTETEEKK